MSFSKNCELMTYLLFTDHWDQNKNEAMQSWNKHVHLDVENRLASRFSNAKPSDAMSRPNKTSHYQYKRKVIVLDAIVQWKMSIPTVSSIHMHLSKISQKIWSGDLREAKHHLCSKQKTRMSGSKFNKKFANRAKEKNLKDKVIRS